MRPKPLVALSVLGETKPLISALPLTPPASSIQRPTPLGSLETTTRRYALTGLLPRQKPQSLLWVRPLRSSALSPLALESVQRAKNLIVFVPEEVTLEAEKTLREELSSLSLSADDTPIVWSADALIEALERTLPLTDERLEAIEALLQKEPSWRSLFDLCFLLERFDKEEAAWLPNYLKEKTQGWPKALQRALTEGLTPLRGAFASLLEELEKTQEPEKRQQFLWKEAQNAEGKAPLGDLSLFLWENSSAIAQGGPTELLQKALSQPPSSPVAYVAEGFALPSLSLLREETAASLPPTPLDTYRAVLETRIKVPHDWPAGDAIIVPRPNKDQLAVGGPEGIELWEISAQKKLLGLYSEDAQKTRGLAFHPDGERLLSIGGAARVFGHDSRNTPRSCSLFLWRLQDGKLLQKIALPFLPAGPLLVLPDGERVVILGELQVTLFDLKTQRWIFPKDQSWGIGGSSWYYWMQLRPDQKTLLTSLYHSTQGDCPLDQLELWDLETGERKVLLTSDFSNPNFMRNAQLFLGGKSLCAISSIPRRDKEPGSPYRSRGEALVSWILTTLKPARVVNLSAYSRRYPAMTEENSVSFEGLLHQEKVALLRVEYGGPSYFLLVAKNRPLVLGRVGGSLRGIRAGILNDNEIAYLSDGKLIVRDLRAYWANLEASPDLLEGRYWADEDGIIHAKHPKTPSKETNEPAPSPPPKLLDTLTRRASKLSPNETRDMVLALASSGLELWSVAKDECVARWRHPSPIRDIRMEGDRLLFSSGGRIFALAPIPKPGGDP